MRKLGCSRRFVQWISTNNAIGDSDDCPSAAAETARLTAPQAAFSGMLPPLIGWTDDSLRNYPLALNHPADA
jgi:hypothetical protein